MEQIAIFLSNILLLMNYDGSAEKFSYAISLLVPLVTANIEMGPVTGLHRAGKISRCRGHLKDV